MEDKIKEVIRELFENAPDSVEIKELQEEMISNALEKYEDLIQRGFTEEQAYTMVMASIGDVNELLAALGAIDDGEEGDAEEKKSEYWEKQSEYWKWQGEYWEKQARNLGQHAKKIEQQAKNVFDSVIGSDFIENISSCIKQIIGDVGNNFTYEKGEYTDTAVYNERKFSVNGIESIQMELQSSSVDLDVQVTNDSEILVQELYNKAPEKNQLLEYTLAGSQLKIQYPINVIGLARKGIVRIFLPEDFACKLNEFKAYTASGDITVEKIGAAKLVLKTMSGDIVGKSVSGNVSLNTMSGNIQLEEATSDVTVKTASGDIKIDKMSGKMNVGSASGDITIQDLDGNGNFRTASGDVELHVTKVGEKLEVNTASGDVAIDLPKDSSVQVTLNSASGDINTFFENLAKTEEHMEYVRNGKHAVGNIGAEPFLQLKVNTASGDINVNR